LHLINCNIGKYYGRCPNPQLLKKLSKLFCFFADNLALAKFQCPTDAPLNHNFTTTKKELSKANKNSPAAKQGSFYIKFSFFL